MDPEQKIPWYQSAIVRHQIVMIAVGLAGVFKVTTSIDWDATVTAILAGVAALVPVWTLVTRIVKPAPPITTKAAEKLKSMGNPAPESVDKTKQEGYARPEVLLSLLALTIVLIVTIPGCSSAPQLKPFSNRLAAGYQVATLARDETLTLLRSHDITPGQAQNAQAKIDIGRAALDLAGRTHAIDAQAGESTLSKTMLVLTELSACVDKKTEFESCINSINTGDLKP